MIVPRRREPAALLLAIAMLIASIASAVAATPEPSPDPLPSSGSTDPSLLPTHPSPLPIDRSVPSSVAPVAEPFPKAPTACASRVLQAMPLDERVGQLFMLGIGASLGPSERDLIRARHFGAVTFAAFVSGGTERIRRITDAVQALATPQATYSVRFLVAANQEGGNVQALSGPGFSTIPTALAQGSLTPERLELRAREWGEQLLAAGVNLDLAPVADVVPASWVSINAPIGRLKREFGHTPDVVEIHVRAFVQGMHAAHVLTTVKHFPGLGRVRGNTDFASGVHDRSTTRDDAFLRPFQVAVDVGVPFVMTSLASYAQLDGTRLAAFSALITTDMLRGDLGFAGVIISDDLSADAVRSIPAGQRAVRFLRAGGDMIISTRPREARAMATALVDQATASSSFRVLVDRAALRVLETKESAGLVSCTS